MISLSDEIIDLERELALRVRKYPEWRLAETDPSKVANMLVKHEHQIACTRATIARLKALLAPPTQTSLFPEQ